ncbi:MAG: hypothetical protein RML33_00130 [Acidobacteriota bacterium]|nr:glycerate kinase [Pyrinomonadaceae bacterium]MDW8303231.1 hypothetical protein [Acidobacteriota bacterium]
MHLTRLHILNKHRSLKNEARTGVSLHCHTQRSKEMLDFVPFYAEKLPIISYFWKREREKYLKREGKGIDFSTAYWTPPLPEEEVFRIEKEQINSVGLDAIVSLSDHDSIQANLNINLEEDNKIAPISMEWTVPFQYGFFHVGVHNLPKEEAEQITKQLLDYTFGKEHKKAHLDQLFEMLHEIPQVLIVLNHPLWDIERVGKQQHENLLKNFLKEHGRWIHAFEINGFRSWSENKAVIEMAEALGIPLVTGGDRHGCKPNTVINLTNSTTFSEFVEEIRLYKQSQVVLLPEYAQPLQSRQLQSFSEILALYPHFPEGRQRWFDRVFFDIGDGRGLNPLSAYGWKKGGPRWLRWAIWTLGFLGSPQMRPVFKLLMKSEDRVPKDSTKIRLEIPDFIDLQEIAKELTRDTSIETAS